VSSADALGPDVDRIVDFPWEVLEYLTWVRQRAARRDSPRSYLFDTPEVRFTPTETDLLVAERDVVVQAGAEGLQLTAPRAASAVRVEALGERDGERAARVLALLDGQLPLAVVRAGLDADGVRVLDALLASVFGKLIFAPVALLAAERAISGIEVTRFPGSPYEIERAYWTNMGAVRARSEGLFAALDDDERFAHELRALHVVLLLGEDLQSYYLPASPISAGRAAPGRFMLTPSELIDSPSGAVFVAGPRVNAALDGGGLYHELCCQTLGEPAPPLPVRFRDAEGLDWGRLTRARAATDAADAAWFCPPRPLRPAHLRALRGSLAAADGAARSADPKSCLGSLALFHQQFVQLHPFHCGNQSLAMNLVNHVLSRAIGAGMPHLFLDHLAFRLSPAAYARVFRRAVDAYVDPTSNVATRYLRLASNRTRTFALLRQLETATSLEQAAALARADAASARLLLL